jgi:hypothetical protein
MVYVQATRNFDSLLSAPAMNTRGFGERPNIRDAIRSSPFREGSEPLLFPFLILEAKSEKSSNGSDDIQAQTAFPIWALLKLQEDLQAKVSDMESEFAPLAWFFASGGDAWRVYGCYTTEDEAKRYISATLTSQNDDGSLHFCNLITFQDIVQLWDGCILSKNSALQLLLIVDYLRLGKTHLPPVYIKTIEVFRDW